MATLTSDELARSLRLLISEARMLHAPMCLVKNLAGEIACSMEQCAEAVEEAIRRLSNASESEEDHAEWCPEFERGWQAAKKRFEKPTVVRSVDIDALVKRMNEAMDEEVATVNARQTVTKDEYDALDWIIFVRAEKHRCNVTGMDKPCMIDLARGALEKIK